MPIVTINRGSYSRGKAVAEKLAQRLGYECISRDILLDASDEFNIPEIKLIRALHDAPTVLERFTHGRDRYISYIRSALLQYARKDNIVYHGLAGQYFLHGIPHVLKVRIIADMQDRVLEEMRRESISAEEALYILKKDDEERRKWGIQVYGTDTWDSRLYDVVLHIQRLSIDDAVDILYDMVRRPVYQPTAESRRLVDNLALAALVKAKLALLAPGIGVSAEDGNVAIHYPEGAAQGDLPERIKTAAAKVEGVRNVQLGIDAPMASRDHINPFHNI